MTTPAQTLSDALFGWFAGRLYPHLKPEIEGTMTQATDQIIAGLDDLKGHVMAAEERAVVTQKLVADLQASIAASDAGVPPEVQARFDALKQHVDSILPASAAPGPDTTPAAPPPTPGTPAGDAAANP